MTETIFILLFFSPIVLGLKRIHENKQAAPYDSFDADYRKCESPLERRLYKALRNNGYIVKTKVPCGKFRINLPLMGSKLAIKCDGKANHSTPAQKARDRRKNDFLRKNWSKVLRCSERRINRNLSSILAKIEKEF